MWPLFQSEYMQNSASFLTGREADVSIGQDIDYNKTSFLPNGGSEGYGGNEGANLPFCFPDGVSLGQFVFATGS